MGQATQKRAETTCGKTADSVKRRPSKVQSVITARLRTAMAGCIATTSLAYNGTPVPSQVERDKTVATNEGSSERSSEG